jgi:hypothetical protein
VKKIKLSFIGVGLQSQIAHIVNFHKDKRVELFDIADFDKGLALEVHKGFGFSGIVTNSVDKLIARKPDGVVITVQRPLTAGLVKKCLKAGLHVLSEKPHVFCLKEHNECEKLQNKSVWMKGYNKRWALAAIEFDKNYKKYLRLYGKLISVEMFIDSGNSWLGSKHHAEPTLKRKKSLGRKNEYPKWIKGKNKFLYESNWNFVSHFMDLLEFFNFKKIKNFKSYIGSKVFKSMFEATKLSHSFIVNVSYSKLNHNGWNEFVTFTFESAKITLRYKSPMQKGGSCNLEIMDSNKSELSIKSYKNDWTYETQDFNFINQIMSLKKGKFKKIYNGRISIATYEKIWKSLLKNN